MKLFASFSLLKATKWSTTKQYLSQRMDTHRADYKIWKKGIGGNIRSYYLFDKYGVENCKIILLESVNANSNDELKAREAYYIKSLKCVNKAIPLRTGKEYYNDNKEQIKLRYKTNKVLILEKRKEYFNANKDTILEKQKLYNEANKKQISEYQKQYRIKNKEQLSEKKKYTEQN